MCYCVRTLWNTFGNYLSTYVFSKNAVEKLLVKTDILFQHLILMLFQPGPCFKDKICSKTCDIYYYFSKKRNSAQFNVIIIIFIQFFLHKKKQCLIMAYFFNFHTNSDLVFYRLCVNIPLL